MTVGVRLESPEEALNSLDRGCLGLTIVGLSNDFFRVYGVGFRVLGFRV